ncbi:hypothetical protein SprV_0200605200 [Sparganum proliferum]
MANLSPTPNRNPNLGNTTTSEQIPLAGRAYQISGMYEIYDDILMTNLHKKQLVDEYFNDLDDPDLSNWHSETANLSLLGIFSKGPNLSC